MAPSGTARSRQHVRRENPWSLVFTALGTCYFIVVSVRGALRGDPFWRGMLWGEVIFLVTVLSYLA